MSLAQHVTSTEGVDLGYEPPDQEPTKQVRRMLSYDAFPPQPAQTQVQAENVAAYKVSTAKRLGMPPFFN